jgi:hypothetical protein
MKREILLATAALLAMLILAPMAMGQETTVLGGTTFFAGGGGDGIPAGSPAPIPPTGGSSILLPVAVLLLGSGILTYAILRRR